MDAPHQAIPSRSHEQNARNHTADVIGKHGRPETQGAGRVIPTITGHDAKSVAGKHFDHDNADQRNHQQAQNFTVRSDASV
jgi:hypothetical protein